MIDLPKDINIEKTVLGHIMTHPDSIFEVLDILKDDVFYDVDNRLIYRTILECVENSRVPDSMNVFLANRTINYDLITSMTGGYIVDFRHKCEAIVGLSMKRKMIAIGERLMRDAQNSQLDPFETNDKYTSELIESLPSMSDGNDEMGMFIPQFVKDIEYVQIHGSQGLTTGFESIDKVFGGFIRNQLVLIGARPATGKSAFILNMIEHSLSLKKSVGVISLEMDKKEIYERMASTGTKVKHDKFTKGGLQTEDRAAWLKYNSRYTNGKNGKFYVNDSSDLNFAQIRANAIKWKKQRNIEILFIDHLGLIGGQGNQSVYEHISKVSRKCKMLAKELHIPVIALCQLSRAVESRGSNRPKLADLKDSGNLEADANVVWFLYGDDKEIDPNLPTKTIYCECAKNRGGALFNVELKYAKEILKFKDPYAKVNPFVGYDEAPPSPTIEIITGKRNDNFVDVDDLEPPREVIF